MCSRDDSKKPVVKNYSVVEGLGERDDKGRGCGSGINGSE